MKFITTLFLVSVSSIAGAGDLISLTYDPLPSPLSEMGKWAYTDNVQFSSESQVRRREPVQVGGPGLSGIAIGKYQASDEVIFAWKGCISQLTSNQNIVGLVKPNPQFSGFYEANSPGAIQIGVSVLSSDPSRLIIYRDAPGFSEIVPVEPEIIAATGNAFCGKFELILSYSTVRARINGQTVYEGGAYNAPFQLAPLIRTANGAITFDALTVTLALD